MRVVPFLLAVSTLAMTVPVIAHGQTAQSPAAAATIQLRDSLELKASPELQKALDSLAAAVQALAIRVATDPQLRLAAIQVASGFVITAQQVVTEHSEVLEGALKTAADRIAAAQTAEARKQKRKP
jgi:hypothetical protein